MRLCAAILLVTALTASAQPTGEGLALSAEKAGEGLVTATTWPLADDVADATPGEVPFGPTTFRHPYYIPVDDLELVHEVTRDFGYTEDGVFLAMVGCERGTVTSLTSADMTVWLYNGALPWLVGTAELPITCISQVVAVEVPLSLAGVAFQANETLRVVVRVEVLNPGFDEAPNLYLAAAHQEGTTGLFANWTSEPLLDRLEHTVAWDGDIVQPRVFFYATDAPQAVVRVHGEVSGADVELSIRDAVTDELLYATEILTDGDEAKSFDRPAQIVAGSGTRWKVEVDGSGIATGELSVSLAPAEPAPAFTTSASTAASTTASATAVTTESRQSPGLAAAVALLAGVLAAWRRAWPA